MDNSFVKISTIDLEFFGNNPIKSETVGTCFISSFLVITLSLIK